ncbi:hypothetical protein [Mycobacterium asiaticum]|uniref:Uncharacterized protein n=1 Tax=Mycobacterium asiaticum TaxID=1790 RepID=A0A1A3MWX0_MYCAS|nr:hypothetical protein [Mycobacterium asiaticum]OBK14398.1 hypothetical protein A5636_08530 [Mycobacterium asiaticum]
MAEGIVLTAAAALVMTASPTVNPVGSVSIMVTGKTLAEIDLLIARRCVDIDLADTPGDRQRSYALDTNPVRLDTLSSDPAVVIRSVGIVDRTDLVIAVRFEVDDRFRQRTFVFQHDCGDVCLTADSPVAAKPLPLSRFRSGGLPLPRAVGATNCDGRMHQ